MGNWGKSCSLVNVEHPAPDNQGSIFCRGPHTAQDNKSLSNITVEGAPVTRVFYPPHHLFITALKDQINKGSVIGTKFAILIAASWEGAATEPVKPCGKPVVFFHSLIQV